jgi:integrase
MASVDRHPRSKYFRAFFIGPDGKRICRTLETTERSVAVKIAADLELAARKARAGTLTADRGRKVLNEILEAAGVAQIDLETTAEFCTRWLNDKKKNAPNTRTRYDRVLKGFIDSLGSVAQQPLSAVQPRHVENYRDSLTKAGLSPLSLRLTFKVVSGVFAKAVRQGVLTTNPCGSVELDDARGAEKEPFTAKEVEALLEQAKGEWKTAILLGAYSGMRLSDAVGLTWDTVDLDHALIRFVPKKTLRKGRRLEVPIHPRLLDHLKSLRQGRGGALCRSLAKQGTGGKTGLSRQFIDIMEAAGIKRGATKANKKQARAVSAKSFHSLRHYFNSELLRAGVDEKTRMDLSGHTTTAISRQYAHTDHATRKAAIEKL